MPQHVATHCNTPQQLIVPEHIDFRGAMAAGNCQQLSTTRCNALQHAATRCNTLQHAATRCDALQQFLVPEHIDFRGAAAAGNCQQLSATRCNTPQHSATHCNNFSYLST